MPLRVVEKGVMRMLFLWNVFSTKKLSVCGIALAAVGMLATPLLVTAQSAEQEVTFTKEIAPILQRSCQSCHRPNSVAPMSLMNYEEVRPWARSIKQRTGLRNRMGVMPPWFIEKDVGIQDFKDDMKLICTNQNKFMIRRITTSGSDATDPFDGGHPAPFILA